MRSFFRQIPASTLQQLLRSAAALWLLLWAVTAVPGQNDQFQIKVYEFEDGLSHRNVFKIQQDKQGFIWMATINGLNRFDGYEFIQYHSRANPHRLPFDAITDLLKDNNNRLWLANPDHLTLLEPSSDQFHAIKIKSGEIVRREALVPHSLFNDGQLLWTAIYDEKSGHNALVCLKDSTIIHEIKLPGAYARRPMARMGDFLYAGAFENELWKLYPDGRIASKINLPLSTLDRSLSRIVHLQVEQDKLWILLSNGRVYTISREDSRPQAHPINAQLPFTSTASTMLVEPDGHLWIGGAGLLWFYDALTGQIINYDDPIRQSVKNICTYRQIFKDRTGVIWVASDFGAIKIVQSDNLFSHYLSGGSEYCSNVFCSTRGITEDDKGRIYISYYNSIHVLDPRVNSLRPLFPSNNFFNYPFGLLYFDNALYTGNGWRIDLNTLKADTLFSRPSLDLGTVLADKDGLLWMGYEYGIYQYDPKQKRLRNFKDANGIWDTLDGRISYLYQGKSKNSIWVGTLNNGLWRIDKQKGRQAHYFEGKGSVAPLRHNQINAIYEDNAGYLWIGTANGLHRLNLANGKMRVYTTQDGLPNNFINGILSEGDTCMWVSTDNGLCRFSVNKENCANFFANDGLSANEFNRISFYKARDGRMYFGGLNGVNAFYPSRRFSERKAILQEAPLLLTNVTIFDGDSLRSFSYAPHGEEALELSHRDRMLSFNFAMADYAHPLQNQFSYRLVGYEKNWSPPSSANTARYTNLPAGVYFFRVKARTGRDEWNHDELTIRIIVREAYYKTTWFMFLVGILLLGGILGGMRYRIYTIQKRERVLEALVKARTQELEKEKHKSEELLLNILPHETAEELKRYGAAKAKRHDMVTVMFSDFKGFTRISELLEPEELVAEIDQCFRAFDEIIDRHGLEKIKTVGDAYLCVGGITSTGADEALRVIKAGLEIQEFMHRIGIEQALSHRPVFEARIGIHTGSVVAGIVGIKKFAYDIWGDTVNLASRMETYGEVGKVNISETTYLAVKSHFRCSPHGQFSENISNPINMYLVEEYLGD